MDLHSPASVEISYSVDSGDRRHSGRTTGPELLWSHIVRSDEAQWLRVWFAETSLSGDPAANGAFVRITSLADGSSQQLNAEQLSRWHHSSAYFNGDSVRIDLIAFPGKVPSRIRLESITAGRLESAASTRTICGSADDRVPSNDPRCARLMPVGCTAWLIDDANHQFLTAGHCGPSSTSVIEFNVPLSLTSGAVVHPSPDQQYPINTASIQTNGGLGIGNDYSYFGCAPNTTTGLTAFQVQRGNFFLAPNVAPIPSGQALRIIGYGVTSAPISATWNQVQKTHTGPFTSAGTTALNYRTDTTGGNSGSPVEDLTTGFAIGIHTHAGCTTSGGENHGTSLTLPALRAALGAPRGVCLSGNAQSAPPLYISPDLNNSLGTLNTGSGAFAAVGHFIAPMQGLAFDPRTRRFFGVGTQTPSGVGANVLYLIDPDTGAQQRLGMIQGAAATLNGLGFDPSSRTLFAVAQANGQIYRVDPETLVATPLGAPVGGTIGALDFDPTTGQLLGINDQAPLSRLVRIDPATESLQVVGALGAGITDCNGLAVDPRDGSIFTVNAATGALLRLDVGTGAATVVGLSQGVFGSGFGMAFAVTTTYCPSDIDADGGVTVADLGLFLQWFEQGELRADIDDGSGTFHRDAAVTIDDLVAFLSSFEAGC